ncbi:MAG: HNH endonuclease [Chloroflexi bacterium]|uniref:HNH endonuclease n=1 Tax=Candidatus Chlorohelix allophototropha TaxID=3003348 RepID=A0A8T7M046_9CHLR|nr:HNH endonuclease [Chloroflexota bacterium]WJW66057.1 HNH endonuclease [Chloroflexota bacterium L227-S17]
MSKVLVLNATYEPISFVSLRRAVVLLLKEKAEVIEASVERQLRAERASFPYPLVIRLVTYVPVPRFFNLPLSRRSLLSRDNYTCQYCGVVDNQLTIDHVLPKSRGGKTEWTNVVAACVNCNRKKGNKLPAEAKMYPRVAPVKPAYITVVLLGQAKGNETWARYIRT